MSFIDIAVLPSSGRHERSQLIGRGVIELANVLRGLSLGGRCTDEEFRERMDLRARMEPMSFPISPLLARIGELAQSATPYAAAHLALAEALNVRLVTLDGKLVDIYGSRAQVQVFAYRLGRVG